jgi:hypothetical protein
LPKCVIVCVEERVPVALLVSTTGDGMSVDDHEETGLYLGARDGSVWGSFDDGASWRELVRGLPDVMVVRAARVG